MAKSQQSFNKKEKEKKRRKKQQEKNERREQRKLEREEKGKVPFEDLIRYVDEDGNLTTEKPDPNKKKVEIKLEDIVIGAPTADQMQQVTMRSGKVKFFNEEKGYGFILDSKSKESIFVHINNLEGPLRENDKVTFEIEMGPKGPNAVRVKMQ